MLEHAGKGFAGELTTSLRIEDFRHTGRAQGFAQCLETEVRIQRVELSPDKRLTAIPVDDTPQIHKTLGQRNISLLTRPDLIRLIDSQSPHVRMDPLPCPTTGAGLCRLINVLFSNCNDTLTIISPYILNPRKKGNEIL